MRGTRKRNVCEEKRCVRACGGGKEKSKWGKKWGGKGKKMRGQRRAGLPCLVAFELVRKGKGAAA